MDKKKKKPVLFILIGVVTALLVIAVILLISNKLSTDYSDLNETDQQIISELDAVCKADTEEAIWIDYDLFDKPILAINGTLGQAYLIDPDVEINSFFAQKITMPEDSSLQVYRLSFFTPQLMAIRFTSGNFNTIGKTYSVLGNNVYYTKYSKKESLEPQYSSEHYITFLTHEAFHYYVQNDWADGGRFSEELTESDIDLLSSEYDVLSKMQTELAKDDPSYDELLQYSKEYSDIMEQRIAENPEYLEKELSMETAEGTAQYVGIKASEIVGYDYGIMYFDNKKDVSFSEVIPALESGSIDESFLADRMPYETGSLLCELLDSLHDGDWQKELNSQTKDSPVTLYSEISELINN